MFYLLSILTNKQHRQWFSKLSEVFHKKLPAHREVMMRMKEALRLNYPALVFRYKVGLVSYRKRKTATSIRHLFLLRSHLPVHAFVSELVHQGVLVFLVRERYPIFRQDVGTSLFQTTLVPSQLPFLSGLALRSLSSLSLHMRKLQLISMRIQYLGTT